MCYPLSFLNLISLPPSLPPCSYQFQPARSNRTVALQILLKALVNMPRPDFLLLKSVLPQNIVSSHTVSLVPLHSFSSLCFSPCLSLF